MGLSRDPGTARTLVGDRACPLCAERAWDFDGARVVFLVGTWEGERLADYDRAKLAGRRLRGDKEDVGDQLLGRLSDELQPVRDAARRNRLIQLACNNCGHTELLDPRTTGA
jgi:hypothetical protein